MVYDRQVNFSCRIFLFYAYTDTKILNIYGITLANCIKFLYNKAIESLMAERSCGI